jgi:hypothetical protein
MTALPRLKVDGPRHVVNSMYADQGFFIKVESVPVPARERWGVATQLVVVINTADGEEVRFLIQK